MLPEICKKISKSWENMKSSEWCNSFFCFCSWTTWSEMKKEKEKGKQWGTCVIWDAETSVIHHHSCVNLKFYQDHQTFYPPLLVMCDTSGCQEQRLHFSLVQPSCTLNRVMSLHTEYWYCLINGIENDATLFRIGVGKSVWVTRHWRHSRSRGNSLQGMNQHFSANIRCWCLCSAGFVRVWYYHEWSVPPERETCSLQVVRHESASGTMLRLPEVFWKCKSHLPVYFPSIVSGMLKRNKTEKSNLFYYFFNLICEHHWFGLKFLTVCFISSLL